MSSTQPITAAVDGDASVAVVGIALNLPGATSLGQLRDVLRSGRDLVREAPAERLYAVGLDDDGSRQRQGYLSRIDLFDHRFFGLSRREAETMDPHQRFALALSHAAIEDAGYAAAAFRDSRTGVYLATPRSEYRSLLPQAGALPLLGNTGAGMVGRVAYHLGLSGPAMSIDAGCASGLVALHYAARDLAAGEIDAALVGGVRLKIIPPAEKDRANFAEILAPDGRCKAFSADADGAVDGEGAVVLLLKRLTDPIADGDDIHAVIRGSAVNHNGARSGGLATPTPAAQREVLLNAWRAAGLTADDLGYIEAHGSGTRLGDAVEVEGLAGAFLSAGGRTQPCLIGSIKTNLGHLDCAAGLVGLVKAILSVRHGEIYPSLNFAEPNPLIDFSHVRVSTSAASWPAGRARFAGTSSFSLTGTNSHVVVGEPPQRTEPPAAATDSPYLIKVAARSGTALARYGAALADAVDTNRYRLPDLVHTLDVGRDDQPFRFGRVVRSTAEASMALRSLANEPPATGVRPRPLVLLCSDDAEVPAAASDALASAFEVFARAHDEALAASAALGPQWSAAFSEQYALYCLLRDLGLAENAIIGSGRGNLLVRLVRSGARLDQVVELSRDLPDGQLSADRVRAALRSLTFDDPPALLEVGRSGRLCRMIKELTGESDLVVAAALTDGRADAPNELLRAIAELYIAGVSVGWKTYAAHVRGRRVHLPTYPYDEAICWPQQQPRRPTERAAVAPPESAAPETARALKDRVPDIDVDVDVDVDVARIEQTLITILEEALDAESLSADADYFELGGNSITALGVLDKVQQQCAVRLSFGALYEHRTVHDLARHVAQVRSGEVEQEPWDSTVVGMQRVERTPPLPASFQQESIWFLDQLAPGKPTYNVPVVLRMTGPLDVDALTFAFRELVTRHEVLRSRFLVRGGEPFLIIDPAEPFDLPVVDVSHLGPEQAHRFASELVREEAARPLNMAEDRLIRCLLIRVAAATNVLVITMHHNVDDGWSPGIYQTELSVAYRAHLQGAQVRLPELPIQYADYAAWQRRWLASTDAKRELDYWRRTLAGAPARLELPTSRPRPAKPSHRGTTYFFVWSEELSQRLRDFSRRHRVTLFVTLVTALNVVLVRYSGQSEVVIGTPTVGRRRIETRRLIGFFNNMLALRGDVTGDPTFMELLSRVRETVIGALDHQDFPFEKLVEQLAPERDPSQNPVFQVAYIHQNIPRIGYELPDIEVTSFEDDLVLRGVAPGTAKFDMTFGVWDQADSRPRLEWLIEYATDLFDESFIRQLAQHLETVVGAMIADPNQGVMHVPLPSLQSTAEITSFGEPAADAVVDQSIPVLLAGLVRQQPNAPAVLSAEGRLTYRELDEWSERIAGRLREIGIGAEDVVAVCEPRGPRFIAAILAVLKTGAAYAPLERQHPPDRLAFTVTDSGARAVLSSERLPWVPAAVPLVSTDQTAANGDRPRLAGAAPHPDNAAYVIYTSGSTGRPKGVVVPHRAVTRLVCAPDYITWAPGDVMLHVSSPAFDAAVLEIWGPLLNGAAVAIVEPGSDLLDGVSSTIRSAAVTSALLTAAQFHVMAEHRADELKKLRHLLVGGDVLSPAHAGRFVLDAPQTRFSNVYGPTETCVVVTCWQIADPPAGRVPIGRPISNNSVHVLDTAMNPVPAGVVGEIFIGGPGLARGYLGRPGLTARTFMPDPFGTGQRLYRTGDLGRRDANGTLEFLGRKDDQVKVRGFRVELGEIENVLIAQPDVGQAAVLLERKADGDSQLVAFVVAQHPGTADDLPRSLPGRLSSFLPQHMIPRRYLTVDALPLTSNGKVDRLALTALQGAARLTRTPGAVSDDADERAMSDVWAEVLEIRQVGSDENFFDLGGHSLNATRIIARITEVLGVELPLWMIFEYPTVGALTAALREQRKQQQQAAPETSAPKLSRIERVPRTEPRPGTPHNSNESDSNR